jgi:hypothetical protein
VDTVASNGRIEMSQFGFKSEAEIRADQERQKARNAAIERRAQKLLEEVTDDYALTKGILWTTRHVRVSLNHYTHEADAALADRLDPWVEDPWDRDLIARHLQSEIPLHIDFYQLVTRATFYGGDRTGAPLRSESRTRWERQ